jgi:hypothetical protein
MTLYALFVLAPKMREGDIFVTRVAHHYALGRLTADLQTQSPIETQNSRVDALKRACALAGPNHRVFLYEKAGRGSCVHITCPEPGTAR